MLLPWPHHKSKPKPKDVWKWEGIQNRLLLHLTADKGNKHHNKSVCPLSGLDYLEAIWINSQLQQEALGLDLSPSFDCHFPIVFLFQWRQHTCSLMFHSGLAVARSTQRSLKPRTNRASKRGAFLEASIDVRSWRRMQAVLQFCVSASSSSGFLNRWKCHHVLRTKGADNRETSGAKH